MRDVGKQGEREGERDRERKKERKQAVISELFALQEVQNYKAQIRISDISRGQFL